MPFPTIRRARQHDLAPVFQMITDLAAFHGDTACLELQDLHHAVFDQPPWMTLFVADLNDAIVGYVALCPRIQLQFGVRGFEMHHLFVNDSCRGQGVGRGLIDASIAYAKSHGCAFLSVGTHPDNITAQNVYLLRGFQRMTQKGAQFRLRLDA